MTLMRSLPKVHSAAAGVRAFSTNRAILAARAPSISDIEPDKAQGFIERQQAWRRQQAEAAAQRKEEESQ